MYCKKQILNIEIINCVKLVHINWHTCKLFFTMPYIYNKNAQQVLKNAKISLLALFGFLILDIIFLIQDTKANLILKKTFYYKALVIN